jgi:sulfite exporter TauE/SafE
MLFSWVLAFVASVASSIHCLAMCGGFAVLAAEGPPRSWLWRSLIYNGGRIFTYVFIGVLCGTAGRTLQDMFPLWKMEVGLSLIAGLCILLIGLRLTGVLPGRRAAAPIADLLIMPLARLNEQRAMTSRFSLGLFNGFLPCPLVYAMAMQAAASGSAFWGGAMMLALGLGTLPAMLGAGKLFARFLLPTSWAFAAGVMVCILGVVTLVRSFFIHAL